MRCVLSFTAALAGKVCVAALLAAPVLAAAAQPPIEVGPDSNICVTLHVDQRLWPRPLGRDSGQILSGALMAELRSLYERRGGAIRLPARGNPPRFVTNEGGRDPACRDAATDVLLVARYGPHANGSAFVFDYRIQRGAARRVGRAEVDVAAEIRAGRLRALAPRRTMETVIYEDMAARAPALVDQLAIRRPASGGRQGSAQEN